MEKLQLTMACFICYIQYDIINTCLNILYFISAYTITISKMSIQMRDKQGYYK
jgi:hypothetical protein